MGKVFLTKLVRASEARLAWPSLLTEDNNALQQSVEGRDLNIARFQTEGLSGTLSLGLIVRKSFPTGNYYLESPGGASARADRMILSSMASLSGTRNTTVIKFFFFVLKSGKLGP